MTRVVTLVRKNVWQGWWLSMRTYAPPYVCLYLLSKMTLFTQYVPQAQFGTPHDE